MNYQSAEIYGTTATNEKRTAARKCGGKMDVMTRMMTDFRGQGIGSPRVANKIRGVSKYNPTGRIYHKMSNWYFGPLAPYSGY